MDLSKLELQCGTDTLEVVANVALDKEQHGISNMGTRQECKQHGKQWRYKVTIDKILDVGSGYNLAEVMAVIDDVKRLFVEAGATELFISRFDIRFDNFAPKAYSRYYKLNQLLLSLVAYDLKIPNRYGSTDFITGELKSACIGKKKNSDIQGEYYNKALQKFELGISGRLELRSIQRNIDLLQPYNGFAEALAAEWFDTFNHAAKKSVFTALKADINKHFVAEYDPEMWVRTTEYLAYRCMSIYDGQQASALYAALGYDKRNGGDFFAKRAHQQIVTLCDIKAYIAILRQSALKFFTE